MLKNLYVSYSKSILDPSNNDAIFGYRDDPSAIVLSPSLLKNKLNLIFRFLIWYVKNSGNIIFLVDSKDIHLFSRFTFLCQILSRCEIQNTDNLLKLKALLKSKDKIVVSLFLESSVLNFIQQESRRLDFPIISFSYFDANTHGSSMSIVHSDSFNAKTVIYNLLALVLAKTI